LLWAGAGNAETADPLNVSKQSLHNAGQSKNGTQSVRMAIQSKHTLNGHVPHNLRQFNPATTPDANEHIRLAIALELQNTNELNQLLAELQNPKSPKFRKFLSSEEFASQFGPSHEDFAKVIAFCENHGLKTVENHENRLIIETEGSITNVENAFEVNLRNYKHNKTGRIARAPLQEPKIDAELKIKGIGGLNTINIPRKLSTKTPIDTKSPTATKELYGLLGPKDFKQMYTYDTTLTGEGETIALVQFDGFYAKDILAYQKQAGILNTTNTQIETVLIEGFNGLPSDNNCEVALDIEMALAIAPGLSKIIVYENSIYSDANTVLNKIATENRAKQISCSWCWSGYKSTTTEQILKQFAAQGQTFFTASGDWGEWDNGIDSPTDDPFAISVGGTQINTVNTTNTMTEEVTWNSDNGYTTGGGISKNYTAPIWQQTTKICNKTSGLLTPITQRCIPDISMVANNVFTIADNGTAYNNAGTSIAAPLWAGFMALINQKSTQQGNPRLA
jgi:subtilase family serine protease